MAIISPYSAESIAKAIEYLRLGAPFAFGTETVYGLGADASNSEAVAKIYQLKGRPSFNPLIVHIANLQMAEAIIGALPAHALRLAECFWPGPMSLILPLAKNAKISSLVTAGLSTVALRIPAHKGAIALIEAFGGGIAAPSANPSGMISPTRSAHVAASMGDKLPLILDGGACQQGIESTIIDLSGEAIEILRLGTIGKQQIENCLGITLNPYKHISINSADQGAVKSPGQILKHYAPKLPLRLNAIAPLTQEGWLGFGKDDYSESKKSRNLSLSRNPIEASANLFHYLHELDEIKGISGIAVAPLNGEGLTFAEQDLLLAIEDRLFRASQS